MGFSPFLRPPFLPSWSLAALYLCWKFSRIVHGYVSASADDRAHDRYRVNLSACFRRRGRPAPTIVGHPQPIGGAYNVVNFAGSPTAKSLQNIDVLAREQFRVHVLHHLRKASPRNSCSFRLFANFGEKRKPVPVPCRPAKHP